MLKPHFEIFTKTTLEIFKKLHKVHSGAILTGGTALALQIGHRISRDLDLTLTKPIKPELLRKTKQVFPDFRITPKVDSPNELTFVLERAVKITYFHHPFVHLHPLVPLDSLKAYSLEDIASSKAHVIGRRGEWKDYVDLYFLVEKQGLDIQMIISEANMCFPGEFDEKLFWEQLVYWGDIADFEIDYLKKPVPKKEIQIFFERLAKNKFGLH